MAILFLLSVVTLTGRLPSVIESGARVVWIEAERAGAEPCQIEERVWICGPVPDRSRGIVVAIGADRIVVTSARGVEGVDASPALWGRLIRIEAAADLQDAALRAWRPERSAVRSQLRRFRRVRDDSIRVLKLSNGVFWTDAVDAIDPDAYLTIEGADIGSVRIPTIPLRDQSAETPLVVTAPPPASIAGRVETARGEAVAEATIDLFQPLQIDAARRDPIRADTSLVAVGSTRSGPDGSFAFERVADPPFLAVASSPSGRGSALIAALGPPVIVQLAPPLVTRGRVLRGSLPIGGARIRFVPTAAAWAAGDDPAAFFGDEAASAGDGSFAIALPEQHAGELQIVTADGAVARLPIAVAADAHTGEIALGDIAIPDPRRVVVRLLEPAQAPPCTLIAVGPMGRLGMQMVRASSPDNIYTFDLPEAGEWTFSADCGGRSRTLAPMMATIPAAPDAVAAFIDVRFAR